MSKKHSTKVLYLPIGEARRDLNGLVAALKIDYDYIVIMVRGVPRAALISNEELWSNLDLANTDVVEVHQEEGPPKVFPVRQE